MYIDVEAPKPQNNGEWEKFEQEVAEIFEKFGYSVMRDVRFKYRGQHQIDIIAYNDRYAFFIDCKDHKYIPNSKEVGFIKNQIKRMNAYLKTNERLLGKKSFVLLVTKYRAPSLLNHDDDGKKILSVNKDSLNDLLNNVEQYEDALFSKIS